MKRGASESTPGGLGRSRRENISRRTEAGAARADRAAGPNERRLVEALEASPSASEVEWEDPARKEALASPGRTGARSLLIHKSVAAPRLGAFESRPPSVSHLAVPWLLGFFSRRAPAAVDRHRPVLRYPLQNKGGAVRNKHSVRVCPLPFARSRSVAACRARTMASAEIRAGLLSRLLLVCVSLSQGKRLGLSLSESRV